MIATIWEAPRVSLVGVPKFIQPAHLPVDWCNLEDDEPEDGEKLCEYAGRLCYLSMHNPGRKSTAEYIANIIEQKHGSVLEHANYSFLIEGVSRNCSHELIRHRAGCAYSQLSQRFVEHCDLVRPPIYHTLDQDARDRWQHRSAMSVTHYQQEIEDLKAYNHVKGKKLKEAARSLLPGAAETKILMTANARAWRHILSLRMSPGADAEIARMMVAIRPVLQEAAPSLFADVDECGHTPYWKI